jgi:hypothetical protein
MHMHVRVLRARQAVVESDSAVSCLAMRDLLCTYPPFLGSEDRAHGTQLDCLFREGVVATRTARRIKHTHLPQLPHCRLCTTRPEAWPPGCVPWIARQAARWEPVLLTAADLLAALSVCLFGLPLFWCSSCSLAQRLDQTGIAAGARQLTPGWFSGA